MCLLFSPVATAQSTPGVIDAGRSAEAPEAEARSAQPEDGEQESGNEQTRSPSESLAEWQAKVGEMPLNVDVLFNAGLAAAHAGKLGYARLYVERAHVLQPFDREITDTRNVIKRAVGRQHIEQLEGDEYTEGTPDGIGTWRVTRILPQTLSAILLVLSLWLAAVAYIFFRSSSNRLRRNLSIGAITLLLIVTAISGLLWGGARWTADRVTPAVVVDANPVYQEAPDALDSTRTSRELYEGALVAIEASTEGWKRIRLADEQSVWVESEVVRALTP
jgi:hypothetical protein